VHRLAVARDAALLQVERDVAEADQAIAGGGRLALAAQLARTRASSSPVPNGLVR
jgi:hypothetical protein